MSQPKRFRCLTTEEQLEFKNKVIMPGLVMCDDGNLVSYQEHIDIVADNDIHIKVLDDEVICVREENAALAAENERLRKAGDEMRNEWIDEIRHGDARRMSLKTIEKLFPRIAAWNAAKEGRDAK